MNKSRVWYIIFNLEYYYALKNCCLKVLVHYLVIRYIRNILIVSTYYGLILNI